MSGELNEVDATIDPLRRAHGAYMRSGRQPTAPGETMRTDTAPAYASLSGARPNFIVVTGDATRKAYAWGELTMVREDDHAAGERPFYVISGELDVEAQGVVLTATARSLVLVPRGLRHRHVTTPGTRLLAIYSPGHSVSHEPTGPARESNSEAFRQIQVEAIL